MTSPHELALRHLGAPLDGTHEVDQYYAESTAYLEEAVDVARSVADHVVVAVSLSGLGFTRLLLNDLGGAREAFEESHAVSAELGGPLMLVPTFGAT